MALFSWIPSQACVAKNHRSAGEEVQHGLNPSTRGLGRFNQQPWRGKLWLPVAACFRTIDWWEPVNIRSPGLGQSKESHSVCPTLGPTIMLEKAQLIEGGTEVNGFQLSQVLLGLNPIAGRPLLAEISRQNMQRWPWWWSLKALLTVMFRCRCGNQLNNKQSRVNFLQANTSQIYAYYGKCIACIYICQPAKDGSAQLRFVSSVRAMAERRLPCPEALCCFVAHRYVVMTFPSHLPCPAHRGHGGLRFWCGLMRRFLYLGGDQLMAFDWCRRWKRAHVYTVWKWLSVIFSYQYVYIYEIHKHAAMHLLQEHLLYCINIVSTIYIFSTSYFSSWSWLHCLRHDLCEEPSRLPQGLWLGCSVTRFSSSEKGLRRLIVFCVRHIVV